MLWRRHILTSSIFNCFQSRGICSQCFTGSVSILPNPPANFILIWFSVQHLASPPWNTFLFALGSCCLASCSFPVFFTSSIDFNVAPPSAFSSFYFVTLSASVISTSLMATNNTCILMIPKYVSQSRSLLWAPFIFLSPISCLNI